MSRYQNDPAALAALVEVDRVHRDVYIDPDIFALEQQRLFRNTWNYVGHASQVPRPGDFITASIAGEPLLMIRGDDAVIRVLRNRCAHKGARLSAAPAGHCERFIRCPYHGWAYNLDGSIRAIPLKNGYDGSDFAHCEAAAGLGQVAAVNDYRGFVFIRLAEQGIDFDDYFGPSLSSIDNMVDRAPDGELEVSGGCLRYMHDCNWKMFIENLHDTMHPMVVHESSAGTAKRLWQQHQTDAPPGQPAPATPMAVEQFVPFVSDYAFFAQMGTRVIDNGHGYSGANFSIHSNYSTLDEYQRRMIDAYGEQRAKQILSVNRHNTLYYPSLTVKGAISAIRVARPLAVDKTLIESYTLKPKGAPDALFARTVNYTRLINSPMSIVGHDDLHAYRAIQQGLSAAGNEWVSLHRLVQADEASRSDFITDGTSEASMRNQFRAWRRFMCAPMPADGAGRPAGEFPRWPLIA